MNNCYLYCDILILRLEELYSYTEKVNKKKRHGKQNKPMGNHVQRTLYNSHIGTQQINSSGIAYLLMCLEANTVNSSFINIFMLFLCNCVAFNYLLNE